MGVPESVLYIPCDPVGPGENIYSLSKAYVFNLNCLGEHRVVIEKAKELNKKNMGIGIRNDGTE